MGQYYQPAIVTRKGNPYVIFPKCYSFGMGAKLMEHSYYNFFVGCVVDYLINNPKSRLVWGGDYADANLKVYVPDTKKWEIGNTFDKVAMLRGKGVFPYKPTKQNAYKNVYIINHTKRIYIQCKQTTKKDWYNYPHILPILTCEGNGRGGGDYRGTNMDLVGSWCGNLLSATMSKNEIPQGFKFVEYDFHEDY